MGEDRTTAPQAGHRRANEPTATPCLAVVVPCYNEAATIKTLLDRVLASPFTAQVIVIDDGSTDGSGDLARGVTDDRVTVVEHGLNLGKGAALRRGFAEVRQPYVIVQDADLEYRPELYGLLLQPLRNGEADVVIGTRFGGQPHRALYFWHAVANRLLTLASDALTNLNVSDVMSGAKAFRREVIDSIEVEQDRFGVEPELVAKAAAGRWRVYEVAIPYDGRGYDEGKKITWRDGFGSLFAILRYSEIGTRIAKPRSRYEASGAVGAADADDELATTLDSLDDAGNYADWIIDIIAPHLGARVLEVGAGHGTMSARLRDRAESVVATELSPRAAQLLRERFAGDPRVTVVEGDIPLAKDFGPFDSAVLINVLEHIRDDHAALRELHDALVPGGVIAVYVPAYEVLYSDFDRAIGHWRRYRRSTLTQALVGAGFEMVSLRYLSLPGAIAWLVVARLLGRPPTSRSIARLYDRVGVPVIRRVEARWPAPVGQSVVAIARRPLEPVGGGPPAPPGAVGAVG
jgi:SAM-dependent methyltransferase